MAMFLHQKCLQICGASCAGPFGPVGGPACFSPNISWRECSIKPLKLNGILKFLNTLVQVLPRRIAHCHWWPMMDSHGSLWTSMSLKRNIFHRQVCPWTSKRWWMNIDDSTWTSMKIHAFYHEIPWTSMYFHGFSWPISTGCSPVSNINFLLSNLKSSTVESWYKDHLWAAAKVVFILRAQRLWPGVH